MSQVKPFVKAAVVTPSDTAPNVFRSLYIGTGGDVRVLHADDTDPVTYVGVPSGSYLLAQAKRVYDTGTTATDILGGL